MAKAFNKAVDLLKDELLRLGFTIRCNKDSAFNFSATNNERGVKFKVSHDVSTYGVGIRETTHDTNTIRIWAYAKSTTNTWCVTHVPWNRRVLRWSNANRTAQTANWYDPMPDIQACVADLSKFQGASVVQRSVKDLRTTLYGPLRFNKPYIIQSTVDARQVQYTCLEHLFDSMRVVGMATIDDRLYVDETNITVPGTECWFNIACIIQNSDSYGTPHILVRICEGDVLVYYPARKSGRRHRIVEPKPPNTSMDFTICTELDEQLARAAIKNYLASL